MHIETHSAIRIGKASSSRPHLGPMERVVGMVSTHSQVPVALILNGSRCRVGVARSRQLAMYLAHVVLGESLTAIGAAFGRDRTTVSYACGLIEDMRDDPLFDAEISELELQLQNGDI